MITLDAISSGQVSATDVLTVSHTVGSGANRFLIVGTTVQDSNHASFPILSITYGGVALTNVRSDVGVGNCGTEVWFLIAPAVGTANIVITASGPLGELTSQAISLFGVLQASFDGEGGGTGNSNTPTVGITTGVPHSWIFTICCAEAAFTANGVGQNTIATLTDQSYENSRGTYEDKATIATDTQSFTIASAQPWSITTLLVRPATIISFDSASNSGYQAASSGYSWDHTCTGDNRYLVVGIAMLSISQTVSGITYNSIAMKFLGAKSSVSGACRVELWGLAAPTTGINTIAVTLSGSIASAGIASSFTGVHQASPTEGFNSNQATNVGAADATVDITTLADNDWVVDIIATDDTVISVGADQVQRGNVTGVAGSGGMSTEGPQTPNGTVTMSWSDIGALATWSIAAIALRPISMGGNILLIGVG